MRINFPLEKEIFFFCQKVAMYFNFLFSFQFANLFENNSSAEWTLYISEWATPGSSMDLSNIRVTTKVAVNALLGDTPTLQEYGSAIMYNLGTKEVKAAVNFGIIHKQLVQGFVI